MAKEVEKKEKKWKRKILYASNTKNLYSMIFRKFISKNFYNTRSFFYISIRFSGTMDPVISLVDE